MIVPDWAGYLRFRPQFEETLDPARYTIEWLDDKILTGEFKLWVGEGAAIVAKLESYPTGAMDIHGMIAAGSLEEIRGVLIPQAEHFAKSIGCIGAMISSREGWAKALKANGYELHQTVLRKEL
jgi:hypothetical protein